MQANKKRHIKPGTEYDYLFPTANGSNATIKRNADVYNTVSFIPKVVRENAWQTKVLSELLKGQTVYDTCRNIWQFVYAHIAYKKDADGYEQVRSPARAWHDRHTGVDCDCYTVFISSILWNLQIPHTLRITKYHRDYFQHIYPVVPLANSRHITIDCVVNDFNYEEPYSEKKDYPMDLQYLSGIDDNDGAGDGMELLGKIVKKRVQNIKHGNGSFPVMSKKGKRKQNNIPPAPSTPNNDDAPPVYQPKKKGFFRKLAPAVNKINPAAVLLRNGLLASMKLNLMGVAAKLRWSYMGENKAAAKGIDRIKHRKLVQTRNKIEKIFHTAGGKPINLRKAILGGKGNKDKAVNGLGWVDGLSGLDGIEYMSEQTPLSQLLGQDVFYSENVDGMNGFEGFGELGEPITGAAIAAATAVVAAIAKNLKSIGDLFSKKNKDAANTDVNTDETPDSPTPENNTAVTKTNLPSPDDTLPPAATPEEAKPGQPIAKVNNQVVPTDDTNEAAASKTAGSDKTPGNDDDPKETFWDKNKKWIKPVGIGVGAITLLYFGYKAMNANSNKASPAPSKPVNGLNGIRRKKQHHRKKKQHNAKHHHRHKVKSVALL
jgi:hypothetical protein